MNHQYVEKVVDLTDSTKNVIYNMTIEEACERLKAGDAEAVRAIDGQFALVSVEGKSIKLARSIGRPLRYFIAKRIDGPCLIIADRIDTIYDYLVQEGMDDQFHPSYTRMAPAHYITEIELLGCPDPNPVYKRFFTPKRNIHKFADLAQVGEIYMGALYQEIKKYLQHKATEGPIGVTFSAGIDSGSVFLLTYHALCELDENPARLKAFTLCIDGEGDDFHQARSFLQQLNLSLFHEPVEVNSADLNWQQAVRIVEDYKALDIQSATMNYALLQAIRQRYPEWRHIFDGEGGDENLKDYPIEENPELTIRSVLNNLMLYQEGWGVDSMKHSLTYSGGLSRGYMRSFATAAHFGFTGFSPYTLPNIIEIAEGIPFIELTGWDQERLYALKGAIVTAGVEAITGFKMPAFEKRRFQHGAVAGQTFSKLFPQHDVQYRKFFQGLYA